MLFGKKPGSVSHIVVFLGNPGMKYAATRHNIGFMVCDKLEKKLGISVNRLKYHALTAVCTIGDKSVLLMKPQTYMNLSGDSVSEAQRFYKVPTENILVISDDISMQTGKIRIRRKGSAGGHNGLKDIIAKCGGDNFPRIKVGVGAPPHPDYDIVDWVLGTFKNEDAEIIDRACSDAADAAEVLIKDGIDAAMAKFSQK